MSLVGKEEEGFGGWVESVCSKDSGLGARDGRRTGQQSDQATPTSCCCCEGQHPGLWRRCLREELAGTCMQLEAVTADKLHSPAATQPCPLWLDLCCTPCG